MSARSVLAAVLSLTAAAATPALAAQGMAETGTGGGPASTITAPNTTATGTTKPPGSAAGPEPSGNREDRTDRMRQDDQIMKGICIGCGAK